MCADILGVHTRGPGIQGEKNQKGGTKKNKKKLSSGYSRSGLSSSVSSYSSKCVVDEGESILFPFSTLTDLIWETHLLQHWHTMITFLSPSAFFFSAFIHCVPGQNRQTILCILADFLRPLIKLSNKWSHDVMNLREARNNNTLLCCWSNNQKFTPQQTV